MRYYIVMCRNEFISWDDRGAMASGYPGLTDNPFGPSTRVHKTYEFAEREVETIRRFGDNYSGAPNNKMLKVVGIEYNIVSPFGEVEEF